MERRRRAGLRRRSNRTLAGLLFGVRCGRRARRAATDKLTPPPGHLNRRPRAPDEIARGRACAPGSAPSSGKTRSRCG